MSGFGNILDDIDEATEKGDNVEAVLQARQETGARGLDSDEFRSAFQRAGQIKIRKSLQTMVFGPEATGKTEFCITAHDIPSMRPLFWIASEGKAMKSYLAHWMLLIKSEKEPNPGTNIERRGRAFRKWMDTQQVYIREVAVLDEDDVLDKAASFRNFEDTARLVFKHARTGTIIFDSATTVRDWGTALIDAEAPSKFRGKDGEPIPFAWGRVNGSIKAIVQTAQQKNTGLIVTAECSDVYAKDKKGKTGAFAPKTGRMKPAIPKGMDYNLDFTLEGEKAFPPGKDKKLFRRKWSVYKSSLFSDWEETWYDLTVPMLIESTSRMGLDIGNIQDM